MLKAGTWLALSLCGVAAIWGQDHINAQPARGPIVAIHEFANAGSSNVERAGADATYGRDFEKVCSTVKSEFYDPKLHGVDWNEICRTYRARLADVSSDVQFAALVNAMLGELHASHMAYVISADAEYYMFSAVRSEDMQNSAIEQIGLMGERQGAEYLVRAVLDGGPAEKAGIKAGDRLMAADKLPFFSASSFKGKAGSTVSVELRRNGESKPRTVQVSPIKQNILKSYLDATVRSARIMNVENKKIGYVHLWTMAQDRFRTTLENLVLTKLHDTDGLILDLRDGYGGRPFGYADVFCRPDVSWESQTRNGKPVFQHTGYAKPIVVLINGGTRSAKEFFAYQMHTSHRATLVGTQTAGAFIGAGFVPIGDRGLLEVAEVGLKVDGAYLENNGVRPDVFVAPNGIYTDQDEQLNAAKNMLVKGAAERPTQRHGEATTTVH